MEAFITPEQIFDDTARFDAIARLRESLNLPPAEQKPEIKSPLSIGIEVEMTWRQAFPDLAAQWPQEGVSPKDVDKTSSAYLRFSEEYDRHDKQMKPLLEQTKQVIPRPWRDAYWEFSFLPSNNVTVTTQELAILYDLGILSDNHSYALHMTVAGIDNNRDAYAFLCSLEQNGGTTPERILAAQTSRTGAWACKGEGGLLRRQPSELVGDHRVGYEFRTLVASSQEQLTGLLVTAADLATLMQDKEAWANHRHEVESKLKAFGLEQKPWGKPKGQLSTWMKYINYLESHTNYQLP